MPLRELITPIEQEFGAGEYSHANLMSPEYAAWLDERITTRDWTNSYRVYSRALVRKADQADLDAVALARVLADILDNAGYTHLPFAAHATTLHDRPVWIVSLKRGGGRRHGENSQDFGYFNVYAYTADGRVPGWEFRCR